jgi:hypothetical protein
MDLRSRIRFAFSKGLNPHEFKPRRREDEFILEEAKIAEPLQFVVVRGSSGEKVSMPCMWRAVTSTQDPQNPFRNFEAYMTLRKISR